MDNILREQHTATAVCRLVVKGNGQMLSVSYYTQLHIFNSAWVVMVDLGTYTSHLQLSTLDNQPAKGST